MAAASRILIASGNGTDSAPASTSASSNTGIGTVTSMFLQSNVKEENQRNDTNRKLMATSEWMPIRDRMSKLAQRRTKTRKKKKQKKKPHIEKKANFFSCATMCPNNNGQSLT
jgi:hypothetical protein